MAKYRLCKKKNRLNADKDGLWYAEPVAGRQMRTRTVCRLATKNLTLSEGELELGLNALADYLPVLLAQGSGVQLGRLGTWGRCAWNSAARACVSRRSSRRGAYAVRAWCSSLRRSLRAMCCASSASSLTD